MDDYLFFIEESNRIENINRAPRSIEIEAHIAFVQEERLSVDSFKHFCTALDPEIRFRDLRGLDVYIGNHSPPFGGPHIVDALFKLIVDAETIGDAYASHCAYENLHPFTDGNGRSGRAFWLWIMARRGALDMALRLGFLRTFYYQTLSRLR